MPIDYTRQQTIADRQIRRWGQSAKLRRDGVDRTCYALEVQLSAFDRRQLKNPTNRVFLISTTDLEVPPTKDDSLIWNEGGILKEFRQDAPVSPLDPGGVIIYYELQVSGGRDV